MLTPREKDNIKEMHDHMEFFSPIRDCALLTFIALTRLVNILPLDGESKPSQETIKILVLNAHTDMLRNMKDK